MYGYKYPGNPRLTIDYILKNVDQQYVFESILEHKVELSGYYLSPFRDNDDVPGAFYRWHNGNLKFVDFADNNKSRSCIDAVMERLNLSLPQALNYLQDNFIKGKPKSEIIFPNSSPIPLEPGKQPITVCYRHFSDRDKAYWYDQYGITRVQLTEDLVLPVNWYRFYSHRRNMWITLSPRDVAYAIGGWEPEENILENQVYKIYRPLAERKKGKWVTNCSNNQVGGLKILPKNGRRLVITKSYKDFRILRNSGIEDIIYFQNEGMAPNPQKLKEIIERFEETVIVFDNDTTGIQAAQKLKYEINSLLPSKVKMLSVPERLLVKKVKDPADLYVFSKQEYNQFINKLKV